MRTKVTITVYPHDGDLFGMVFYVPAERDVEEYIEEMLDVVFGKDFSYAFWEFD